MATELTKIEILNSSLAKVAEIRNPYPLNEAGMILTYSKELSDYGECRFRIATEDPIFSQLGDIVAPHRYHVRIKRGNATVWQGIIADNPERTKRYIEVLAFEYLYYLDKILIRRGDTIISGGDRTYQVFDSGTMASNVTTLINNAKSDMSSTHFLNGLTLGTIESPNFPKGFQDADGDELTGAWTFSSNVRLVFDFQSVLYVIAAFGMYADADFNITPDLVFNFERFLGNHRSNVQFRYGQYGNIVDYNLPRLGRRMVNEIIGISLNPSGKLINETVTDNTSIKTYGKIQGAAAYNDAKDRNTLKARIRRELAFTSTPDTTPVNLVLNEKSYPLGVYDIGDIVSVIIKDGIINYNAKRRIVRIAVSLHNTGREIINVETNKPTDEQLSGL